jgi:hypothetical protein
VAPIFRLDMWFGLRPILLAVQAWLSQTKIDSTESETNNDAYLLVKGVKM